MLERIQELLAPVKNSLGRALLRSPGLGLLKGDRLVVAGDVQDECVNVAHLRLPTRLVFFRVKRRGFAGHLATKNARGRLSAPGQPFAFCACTAPVRFPQCLRFGASRASTCPLLPST